MLITSFQNRDIAVFLIILNVHILQPVPGGSSSRAMPMDVDNHQGQFLLMHFHISHECSNFKPLLAGMKNLYEVQIDKYYFMAASNWC